MEINQSNNLYKNIENIENIYQDIYSPTSIKILINEKIKIN